MILTETQEAIRDTVRDFAQEQIKPQSAVFEAAGGYPDDLFERVAALGLMGMTAPEAFGGAGADYVSYALSLMEIAAADGALSTIVSIQNSLIVTGLIKDGTPDQQARFLPDLIAGRMIGAFALTETDAGSDAAAIRTRAVKVDGGYRLTGAKQFISSGRTAGIAIVYAITDPDAAKRGMSGFIVLTDSEGYSVDKVEHKLGQAASDTCAIRLDDVFVPNELRLGREGGGYGIALSNLEAGRIG
ncbi:MAG: acyl-CoA dehydrogenase family protein, partial [Novosphingobium sp.]